VFFDSLAGKAFLARSIKLCLVDNQRSSGVTVVGFESCLISSRIANVEFSTSRTYWLPLRRSGQYSLIGIRDFRFTARYNLVCLRFIFVPYLQSTKSLILFQFSLSYHLCAFAISFQIHVVEFVSVVESCCWFRIVFVVVAQSPIAMIFVFCHYPIHRFQTTSRSHHITRLAPLAALCNFSPPRKT
jgi:hypothetical protein